MARKRMFHITVVDSDAFLDMPLSTQALYFHLNMRADDDGFIGNPKRVKSNIGASDDDLKLLIAKRFLIQFPDGVLVIKHWRIHNTIQTDRYTETVYTDEKEMLKIKDNKAYSLTHGKTVETKCKQIVSTDKDIDIDEVIDKDIINKNVQISKADIDTFFEQLWKLYPNKKGKGQISDAKKKHLYQIGTDELTRAIERYKRDLAKDTWRKPQNGSTFFNNGYVDYLDTNYDNSGKENDNGCTRSNADGFIEEALKAGVSTEFGGFDKM